MNHLYTIGYEGAQIEDFVETLKLVNVDVLLDVRDLPISRRRGFAKTALRQALEGRGIVYRHEKSLGSPKPIRDELKRGWDYETFFRRYDAHLNEQQPLLERLVDELAGGVALMCYERNQAQCHRSAVATALAELAAVEPIHLRVKGTATQ